MKYYEKILKMISEQMLYNKIKGMVFLSLYGDSLGFPHEFKFNLNIKVELHAKKDFISPDMCQDPWACWTPFDEMSSDTMGILSDDSFYKLEIFIPYLVKYKFYEDSTFAEYCLDLLDKTKPCTKRVQIVDWLFMFSMLDLEKDLLERIDCRLENEKKTQIFYMKEESRCFGLFLFLWQGIIDKKSRTNFDSKAGEKITDIFLSTLSSVFKNEKLDIIDVLKNYNEKYYEIALGFKNKIKSNKLEDIRLSLYEYRQNLPKEVIPLKHDPFEFFICFAIAQSVFPQEPLKGLKLLCSSGGDSDTIGSIWGSFLGAEIGYEKLIKDYPELKKDFFQIESFLQTQSINLNECLKSLNTIASSKQSE